MNCPNCSQPMIGSDIVIDTEPPLREYFCRCGVVVDNRDSRYSICWFKTRDSGKFTPEQIKSFEEKLRV